MSDDALRRNRGEQSAAIANLVVRLARSYTGRGPTRARTYRDGDLISVVLEDSLTQGERSLVHAGHGDEVVAIRRRYQEAMRGELCAGVEQVVDRSVVAFFSDNSIEPDVVVQTFLLAPELDEA